MLPTISRTIASTPNSITADTSHAAVVAATSTSLGKYTFRMRFALEIRLSIAPVSPLARNVQGNSPHRSQTANI